MPTTSLSPHHVLLHHLVPEWPSPPLSLSAAHDRTCSGLVQGSDFLFRIALCRASFSTWMALSTAEASSSRSSASSTVFRVADRGLSLRLPGPGGRKQVLF